MGFVWTDDPLVVQVTAVKALHWNEIQDGLDAVYAAIGCDYNPACGPDWTADPIVVIGDAIVPTPTTELRQRSDYAHDNCCTTDHQANQADEKSGEDTSANGTNRVGYDSTDDGTNNGVDVGTDNDSDENTANIGENGTANPTHDNLDNPGYESTDESIYDGNDENSYNPGYVAGEETGYDGTHLSGYVSGENGVVA